MKRNKIISLLLAALMLFPLAACTQPQDGSDAQTSSEGEQDQGDDTEDEEEGSVSGTVKIMSAVTGGKDDEEMVLFEEALSEATGLKIEIERPASDYSTILMQKLSGGEVYDLIYVNASEYASLVDQGALLDITDDIASSDILSQNVPQSEWDDITIDDKIYAGFNKLEVHRVVAANNVMLKEAGIDYATIEPTLDGYYNVFKALKDTSDDPDFYPYSAVLKDAWDIQPWMAAVGAKGGVVVDENGERYVPYAQDDTIPVWEWFKKLYDEKLLDPAAFVDGSGEMREKMGAASEKVGVVVDWVAWVGLYNNNALTAGVSADEYEVVPLPGIKTPDGDYMLAKGSASLFAVPSNSQNPDGAIAVLEYFATQEGGNLLSSGIEGHDYIDADGTYELTEIGSTHGNDHGAPFPIYSDYEHLFPLNPGVSEGMEYLEYATIDMIIPNESDYKEVVGYWAGQMIRNEVSIEDGLQSMRDELVERDVTDR